MLNQSNDELQFRSVLDGFDDGELLHLSRLQRRTDAGHAPWASWEVENSSFGKTLRAWTGYPSWLPLCAVSDHGVHWESRCWPNEIESPYRLFLTWNRKKARLMRERYGKEALHIPHPWLAFRKKHYPTLDEGRTGTVVFFTHSNATTTPVFESLNTYMQSLHDLPASFHPIVICLSFHDVLKGMHHTLRSYGFPIVTAGTTSSQGFIDRFYGLARCFRYACSPTIGSHSFYLAEAGVVFFLYGPRPTYVIKGSRAVRDGEQDLRDYGDEEDIERYMYLHRLFAEPGDEVSLAQRAVVEDFLGAEAATKPFELNERLRASLRMNLPHVARLYLRQSRRMLGRLFLFGSE